MVTVHRQNTAEETIRAASAAFNSCLKALVGQPALLLFSGGSALKITAALNPRLVDRQWTISVLDDRFTGDPRGSNFLQLAETPFVRAAAKVGAQLIATLPKETEPVEAVGKRFDQALKEWRMNYPDQSIIITQGIGADGHTAGIFPMPDHPNRFQALFDQTDNWAVGYSRTSSIIPSRNERFPTVAKPEKPEEGYQGTTVTTDSVVAAQSGAVQLSEGSYGAGSSAPDQLFSKRTTVTLPFLRQITTSFVLIIGQEKQAALRLIVKPDNVWAAPARIICAMPQVQLFTDLIPPRLCS